MMKWKLGRFADINVYVHWSFWILPAVILLSTVMQAGVTAGVSAVAILFAAFTCVILHEYGHALTARTYGIRTRDITLYPIGGVASLERIPRDPIQELVVAAAGPAVNVLLAIVLAITLGFVYTLPLPGVFEFTAGPLSTLLAINVALVVFNLLPAFPMDGGRILRAVLAMAMRYEDATLYAARTGQVVAVLLGVVGLTVLFNPGLMLIAAFVFIAAQAELNSIGNQAAFPQQASPVGPTAGWSTPFHKAVQDSGIVWVEERRQGSEVDSGVVYILRTTRPHREL